MPPPCQWPPLLGTKNLGPPKDFVLKNPMFLAYFGATKSCQLDTQDYFGHEGEVYHGWKCLWSLNNIAYCMFPMQKPLGPEDFQTQESRRVCCPYKSCLGMLITGECFVCMTGE